VGNKVVPSNVFGGDPVVLDANDARTPGACPPSPIVETSTEPAEPSVPTSRGEARILGIADLMMVEQQLLRYELGEVAHLENVLKSERRARTFRTSTTTEQSELIETEATEEKQRDLSTADRFNLQTETQNVIGENASMEAGLTINASYGPSIDASSTFNYATS